MAIPRADFCRVGQPVPTGCDRIPQGRESLVGRIWATRSLQRWANDNIAFREHSRREIHGFRHPSSSVGMAISTDSIRLSVLFIHPRASLLIFLARARQYPRHDLVASALPRLDVRNAPLTGARESRSSAAARRAPTLGETATALESGPWPLGALAQVLDRLGEGPRDRSTRHRSALAPCRLPTLLDVEESGDCGRVAHALPRRFAS